jgi:signal transduction histidine kinase
MEAMDGPGRITITESEGFIEPLGRVAVLSVSDSGLGVPEPERERVFEPFHTTKEEGTGLGLPIARRIVTEHGGTLTLTQAKGGGAKFTITLPFDAEAQGGARWQ